MNRYEKPWFIVERQNTSSTWVLLKHSSSFAIITPAAEHADILNIEIDSD